MITINNKIDIEYQANIFYKGEFIGTCENELAFLDVRRQIKNEEPSDYSFEIVKYDYENHTKEVGKRYNFTRGARFPRDMDFELYWNAYDNILSDLL